MAYQVLQQTDYILLSCIVTTDEGDRPTERQRIDKITFVYSALA